MKNILIIILVYIFPIIVSAQCGTFTINVIINDLHVTQDSVLLDCEADMEFIIKLIEDTLKLFEINKNIAYDCGMKYNTINLEIAGLNSDSYMLKIYLRPDKDINNDTILCGQYNFTVDPGNTSDSVYIKKWVINEITSTSLKYDKHEIPKISQIVPNPFNIETEIKFYLPEEISNAVLNIYDMQGLQIKSYVLSERENSSVIINASELLPGMYLYSLIADNEEIDTKRMILTE